MKLTYYYAIIFLIILIIIYYAIDIVKQLMPFHVEEFPNFLTPDECDHLIKISKNNLEKSETVEGLDEEHRLSMQTWINDDDSKLVARISKKVSELTQTDIKKQEPLQIVKYDKNGFFNPHYDSDKSISRHLTFLIYLNDDFEGGETVFPHINKRVKPVKGKAVLWHNMFKNGAKIYDSFHGGDIIKNGDKWIATKWVEL